MYQNENQFQTTTFFYQQPTYHYDPSIYGQPRVGNFETESNLMSPDRYSYNFRRMGLLLGLLVLFSTVALISTELGRLYTGSVSRARMDLNDSVEISFYPNRIVGFNGNLFDGKIENRWMWPWSTATLFFSLLFFATGILGLISGQRETYSTILTFFICSLVSLFLLIFLIISYSTTIAGWKTIYPDQMPRYARVDRDLSIVCLSMSCFLWLLQLINVILSGMTIDLCSEKTFSHGDVEPEDFYKASFSSRIGF